MIPLPKLFVLFSLETFSVVALISFVFGLLILSEILFVLFSDGALTLSGTSSPEVIPSFEIAS